jgi:hypothetical protein
MSGLWPWLVLAGLGAFHGLNPAMGWLFAVALGMHRHSRAQVLSALIPIALGHALSIATVAIGFLAAGFVFDQRRLQIAGGLILLLWATYHQLYGHRRRTRIGMQAGQAGLLLWSFLMATAHGAGLMLLPAMIPLCFAGSGAGETAAAHSAMLALAAVAVHTTAMLLVTANIALLIYDWLGLAVLRTAWVNTELVWTAALAGTGVLLIALA